jgi:hypothetical protein
MKAESDYIFSTSINKGLSGIVKVTNPPTIVCFCDEVNGKKIIEALNASEQCQKRDEIINEYEKLTQIQASFGKVGDAMKCRKKIEQLKKEIQ